MKVHLTTLHVGRRTCAMTEPVSGRQPVLALLIRLLWLAVLVLPSFGTEAAVVFTSLYSFQVSPTGANPSAGLVQGRDGNFYGTTSNGGTNGDAGTVFKIGTAGALTSLHSFTGGNDGGNPTAGLVQGSDGSFYGTTQNGGTNGDAGTVFKISTAGALTSLYSFTGGNDGGNPTAGLVQGSDGSFYGTTQNGGTNGNAGTVFKISADGALTTLYSFGTILDTNGNALDGANPGDGLVQGSDGNFYGTTANGGTNFHMCGECFGPGLISYGTIFKISTTGALTTLYSFGSITNASGEVLDGSNPQAGLVQGSDGNFYGTTAFGGTNGEGTVFQISTNGALTSLYSFSGGNDGGDPVAGLVQGSDGSFYGTTQDGGTNNLGTVFKISTNGLLTSWYSFNTGDDGNGPQAGLAQGSDGNFYGTTAFGGTNGTGTVFEMSTNGALTSLYSFTTGSDGAASVAGLAQGSDGNFYGTTEYGGTHDQGTVFKISTNGALTSLHSFSGGDDGGDPVAGLVQASDGNLYGTTEFGGTYNVGTVFKITTNGAMTTLYSFDGSNGYNGYYPRAGLVQGSDGNLYGTTAAGPGSGFYDQGTVFQISYNGALTTIHSFVGANIDGADPNGLVLGSDGLFYGTTAYGGFENGGSGCVFRISTNGSYGILYSFPCCSGGAAYPNAGLVQGSDGFFYGTTLEGGTNGGWGTVFQISSDGALTSLFSFSGLKPDGGVPYAGLVQGSDGNLYGTTSDSPYADGYGTAFRISTNGALTTIHSFTGGKDGANPRAGLVQGSDGNFYGTTESGGVGGGGTVFRLTIVPEFQAVTLTNNTLNLTWSTEAGGTYQLQSTSDLRSSNWSNLGGPITATGATLSTTDSLTNGPQRFYRLVLAP